jgi:RNA polymerase sigma-70 factor (ECF subfamily)
LLIDDIPEEFLSRAGDQDDKVLTREIIQAMDKLQPRQREVLILICASGLSYEEAAESLQCSVGTIKSRLWRARRHMQALVMGEERATVLEPSRDADEQEDAPSEARQTAAATF